MSGTGPFGGPGAGPFGGAVPGAGGGLWPGAAGPEAIAGIHRAFVEAVAAAWGPRGDAGADPRGNAAPGDGPDARRAFEAFGARFFGGAAPSPGPFATTVPPGADAGVRGPLAALPALGPTREHQLRVERLQSALARLAAAQQAQGALLAAAGARAGAEFLGELAGRDVAGDGLRATFDRWIERSEAAWQRLAHSAEWCSAQARTFDAAIDVRAAQQAVADDAARLAGVPTLRDVDQLHRRLRDLERSIAPRTKTGAPTNGGTTAEPGSKSASPSKPAPRSRPASRSKPASKAASKPKPASKSAPASRPNPTPAGPRKARR